eukprot:2997983-Rhodomonas_salina.6
MPAVVTIPIFCLISSHIPPMSTLPTSPVLSIPQYLDCIDNTLKSYDPTLCSCFEALQTHCALDVFPDPHKLKLGQRCPEDLQIIEEPCLTPVLKKVYRLSPLQISKLKQQLTKMIMIEAGNIQPSNSPYGAPILLAPKKDKRLHLCIDYSTLNAWVPPSTHTPCLSSQVQLESTTSLSSSSPRHGMARNLSTQSSGLAIPTPRTPKLTTPSSSRSLSVRWPLKPGKAGTQQLPRQPRRTEQ